MHHTTNHFIRLQDRLRDYTLATCSWLASSNNVIHEELCSWGDSVATATHAHTVPATYSTWRHRDAANAKHGQENCSITEMGQGRGRPLGRFFSTRCTDKVDVF